MLRYETYVKSYLGKYPNGKRKIKGIYKIRKTGEIIKGDNFDAFVCGNAEESYKAALSFFNYTEKNPDLFRDFVSAEWDN